MSPATLLPRELCCWNFVFTALCEMHSSNLRSKSWNSKYRIWKPSAMAPMCGGLPLASSILACNVSRAETKNTRSAASFSLLTFSSLVRKSMQRSVCCDLTWRGSRMNTTRLTRETLENSMGNVEGKGRRRRVGKKANKQGLAQNHYLSQFLALITVDS